MPEIFLQSRKNRQINVKLGLFTELNVPKEKQIYELLFELFSADDLPDVIMLSFFNQTGWHRQEIKTGVLGITARRKGELWEEKSADLSYTEPLANLYKFLLSLQSQPVELKAGEETQVQPELGGNIPLGPGIVVTFQELAFVGDGSGKDVG